jgi:CO/xanthine dehydrogenase Mo-binding subunit
VSTTAVREGIGESARRIDGVPKVTGAYAYGSDLQVGGMVWATTLRSPHASARIRWIDAAAARRAPGVVAVVTAEDLPRR